MSHAVEQKRVQAESSWVIQVRVWRALLFRELKTRFGVWKLGYFWMVLQPLAHIGVFLLLFEFGAKKEHPGMDFSVFLLTGLLPFFAFQNSLTICMQAVSSNKGLFNYTRVKPMDSILVRWFIESLTAVVVFISLFFVFWFYLGIDPEIKNVPAFMGIVVLLFLFNFGIGSCFAIMGSLYPESKKFVSIIMRPLYFVSGIFFLAEELPPTVKEWLLWNPVFNFIELIRHYFFPTYTSPDASITYGLLCAFGFAFLGSALYQRFRQELLTS